VGLTNAAKSKVEEMADEYSAATRAAEECTFERKVAGQSTDALAVKTSVEVL
jgi:hypothetical protein